MAADCSRCVFMVCVCTLDWLNAEHDCRVWVTTFTFFSIKSCLGHQFGLQRTLKKYSTHSISCSCCTAVSIYCTVPEDGNSDLKQLLSKSLAYFNYLVNYSFNVNKTPNTKRKITHYSWLKNFNTVYLIGINLYSVLFLYLSIQFLEITLLNTPIAFLKIKHIYK